MRTFSANILIVLMSLISFNGCGQTKPRVIYNKDFNWTITIPENFEKMNAEQWKALQNKGKDAIEKTFDEEVENNAKTIFVFRSDDFNYFEANYQPFDTAVDGNFMEVYKGVNDMLYMTFEAQMPDAKLDSVSSTEQISGLTFQTFKVTITFPNNMIMEFLMYSRLFGRREFTVNIVTVDKNKQKALLEAWIHSKFEKR